MQSTVALGFSIFYRVEGGGIVEFVQNPPNPFHSVEEGTPFLLLHEVS